MSQQQNLALSSTDNQVSSPDYGPFGMPEFHPPSEPVSAYPGNMENYEMERYVLQSLELLASTPTTQYYGPEIPQSDALPRSKPQHSLIKRCLLSLYLSGAVFEFCLTSMLLNKSNASQTL